MYRRYGACSVVATEFQKFGDTEKLYYCLEPLFGKKTKFFVPADMPQLDNVVRALFTKQQLIDAIHAAEQRTSKWEDDGRARFLKFNELMSNGSLVDMLWLIKILNIHRNELRAVGRTFVDADKRVLAFVERLVTDEFVCVFGLERTAVMDFIRSQVFA